MKRERDACEHEKEEVVVEWKRSGGGKRRHEVIAVGAGKGAVADDHVPRLVDHWSDEVSRVLRASFSSTPAFYHAPHVVQAPQN